MGQGEVQEQLQELRDALTEARSMLVRQQEALERLTDTPLIYAVVVTACEDSSPEGLAKKGTRVRIRRDSEYASQNSGAGVVTGPHSRGWVHVQFDDGYDNNYRVGLHDVEDGIRDLEFADSPTPFGTAIVMTEGKMMEVNIPDGLVVRPGNTAKLNRNSMQIVGLSETASGGSIGYLRRTIDATFSEVECESQVRVVFNGGGEDLATGDRVVLDDTSTVIIRNLGQDDERFRFTAETDVSWDDIGGLDEAKRQMIEAVELPHRHPELFSHYGKRPVKGVLLYGPPGCGKTMIGKATATALANVYGDSESTGFIYIKGPEILERYVGMAEATIRQIFARARKHREEFGYPAVVFIDEADALLAKRGSGISSDIERTIVPMFLTEMDGLVESGALVILATNRSDVLDPAVVRDGRIDRKIKVSRPTLESAADIFRMNLERVPLSNGYSYDELAKIGSDELFASHRVLYRVSTKENGSRDFTLGHLVNGGMVVGIVEQATSTAMWRDLESGSGPEGLRKEDIVSAVDAVENQNRDLNHTDELAEYIHDFRDDVVGITRLSQSAA